MPAVVMQVTNPEQKRVDHQKFKANLIYIARSRPARSKALSKKRQAPNTTKKAKRPERGQLQHGSSHVPTELYSQREMMCFRVCVPVGGHVLEGRSAGLQKDSHTYPGGLQFLHPILIRVQPLL